MSRNKNSNIGTVIATNLSSQKGTIKHNVKKVLIDQFGVHGDAHAGPGHRQISFLNGNSINAFSKKMGKKFEFGAFGENITFTGIDSKNLGLLDQLQINNTILEVTQIGKQCHGNACAIYRKIGKCIMPQEGFFTRVIHPGKIKVGDIIDHRPYILKLLIITLSDRAASGIYEDLSGEIAKEMLTKFLTEKHWHLQIEKIIIPDDTKKLSIKLRQALKNKVDIIFTLGGTGIGNRDITPETVSKFCDKLLPRLMDYIALKYGATHPAALLSRSIAGITKKTQIYTLPGSKRAVSEYLTEIFKVLEHIIFMLHGIDRHD